MLKKISKQFTILTLILLIVFSFSGCTNKTQTTSNNYKTITDQAGREVKIPEKIEKIYCTSPLGSVFIYSLSPEKLVAWNNKIPKKSLRYLNEDVAKLPVAGSLQGKKSGNIEEISKLKPDIVISMGDINDSTISWVEKFQKQSNIPFILVDGKMDKLPEDVTSRITNMVKSMGDGVTNILSNSLQYITSLISTIFLLIMVPFFLIYMLKDHEKFIPAVAKFLGIFLYIGYSIIDLPYIPLLVLFAGVANLIPFLGSWLSFAPAAILGIIDSPTTFIWVCIITLIAHQLEGNIITPNVMGKSLSIHPLTIIVVILAAGDLGGFTLVLIAVPLYAVLKTVVSNIFKYRQRIIDKANSNVKD